MADNVTKWMLAGIVGTVIVSVMAGIVGALPQIPVHPVYWDNITGTIMQSCYLLGRFSFFSWDLVTDGLTVLCGVMALKMSIKVYTMI